jgi:phosphopantothenoylcysteine decarboxylase/phosphopantothenate--cysteine ligase
MDRSILEGRLVAVGVGGGIAAYKACELVRELGRAGAEVRVAMTPGAREFVTPLTFQNLTGRPVLTDYFDPSQEASFGHLDLAKWAEIFIIAPATADLLARIRAGMANDAVTTPLLAFRGPVLLAPAMNVAMYENPFTQENLRALRNTPRHHLMGPDEGLLACGDVGAGRLVDILEIVDESAKLLSRGAQKLKGRRVLITAGPTREFMDPVRFISNPSTGKMGLALAQEARRRGAEVTVVLGPVSGEGIDRSGLHVVDVVTAEEMAREVLARIESVDAFVATAAVSDYRPQTRAPQKRKKTEGAEELILVRTPDVLLEASKKVSRAERRPILIGFAAETERVVEHANLKLQKKNLDWIVANDVARPGAGFGADTNSVICLSRTGDRHDLSGTKRQVASAIWDLLIPGL